MYPYNNNLCTTFYLYRSPAATTKITNTHVQRYHPSDPKPHAPNSPLLLKYSYAISFARALRAQCAPFFLVLRTDPPLLHLAKSLSALSHYGIRFSRGSLPSERARERDRSHRAKSTLSLSSARLITEANWHTFARMRPVISCPPARWPIYVIYRYSSVMPMVEYVCVCVCAHSRINNPAARRPADRNISV